MRATEIFLSCDRNRNIFYSYLDHLTVSLITAVPTVLVTVTDHVGGQTEAVTTAVVPGLGLCHVKTETAVGLVCRHRTENYMKGSSRSL